MPLFSTCCVFILFATLFLIDLYKLSSRFVLILRSSLAALLLILPSVSFANARDIGDEGRILIPITAALGSVLMRDMQGVHELSITLLVATGATESLKYLSHEERPNGECCASFPSGHTSIAFGGAAYIHHRYGLTYSLPFYAAASYVGYSRVFAKSHYTQDVVAGAAVGILSAWVSTTAFKDRSISLVLNRKYAGILYRKVFA